VLIGEKENPYKCIFGFFKILIKKSKLFNPAVGDPPLSFFFNPI
jgi:hypothetical protein